MTYPALDSTLVQTQIASWRRRRRRERRRQFWAGMGWFLAAIALLVGPMLWAEWLLP